MKTVTTIIAVIGLICMAGIVRFYTNQGAPNFNEIVVFGDSLSDQGNVFFHTEGEFPKAPYYEGRFTNGKVWVEQFAESMGQYDLKPSRLGGTNYAHGGARTGSGYRNEKPNIGEQVNHYLQDHKVANRDALYVVWGGGNDFFGGTFLYTIENLEKHIGDLAKAKAKYFLVPNFAPLSSAPVFTHEIPILLEEEVVTAIDDQIEKYLEEKLGKVLAKMCKGFIPTLRPNLPKIKEYLPEMAEELSKRIANFMEEEPLTFDELNQFAVNSANAVSKMYNDYLTRVLNDLEKKHKIKIYRLNVYDIFDDFETNGEIYGFKEIGTTALDPKTHELRESVDPDEYVFFDGIHPSAKTHSIIADRAYKLFE